MPLSNRHLGYLVIAGVFFLLVLINSAARNDNGRESPPPPPEIIAPAPPKKSAPSIKVPKNLCLDAARYVAKMKKAGMIDYWIAPPDLDGLSALVYVEPKLWLPMLHKDKIAFVRTFIAFFMCHNQDHPGPGQVPFFAVKNMSTKERLARGWVIDHGEGSNPGTVEIFK